MIASTFSFNHLIPSLSLFSSPSHFAPIRNSPFRLHNGGFVLPITPSRSPNCCCVRARVCVCVQKVSITHLPFSTLPLHSPLAPLFISLLAFCICLTGLLKQNKNGNCNILYVFPFLFAKTERDIAIKKNTTQTQRVATEEEEDNDYYVLFYLILFLCTSIKDGTLLDTKLDLWVDGFVGFCLLTLVLFLCRILYLYSELA